MRDGGSAWSFAIASAALAQQSATAVRQPASPALAVKAGRQRGISVLDKRRQEEQQEMAAAEAAAAKRKKIIKAVWCRRTGYTVKGLPNLYATSLFNTVSG